MATWPQLIRTRFWVSRINVKKIAFGHKEHITDKKMGVSFFIETLHKQ